MTTNLKKVSNQDLIEVLDHLTTVTWKLDEAMCALSHFERWGYGDLVITKGENKKLSELRTRIGEVSLQADKRYHNALEELERRLEERK